jgi:hypothetical protein
MRNPKPRYYTTQNGAERRIAAIKAMSSATAATEGYSPLEAGQSFSVLPAQHPYTGRFCYVVALMENGKLRAYCA